MRFNRLILAVLLLCGPGCDFGMTRRVEIDKAENQVKRLAEDLDKRTTKTGAYIRAKKDEIQERDPWGTPVEVSYSQGGVAEMVEVRSAGPDRELRTKDDVTATCMAANFKGLGEGIKEHAEQTASNAAKGVVKGTFTGVKEAVKDAMPFKKKKPADPKAIDDKNNRDADVKNQK